MEEEYYVVLEPGQDERFLTPEELRSHLTLILTQERGQPPSAAEITQLIDTACELPLGPGRYCQWYVTRLDRPSGRKRSW